MIIQGDSPSIGLIISLVAATIVGWGIIRLSGTNVRAVVDAITLNS
jgi:hypothetical protein